VTVLVVVVIPTPHTGGSMSVHPLLAAIATMPDVPLGPVLTQIWHLAERTGDTEVMRTVASRDGALPSEVVERLRLRKEPVLRIAYLSRNDISDTERSSLLAAEKRSDVFAGLIAAAKENGPLAERLKEQFDSKPTKVLARQMLRDDFGDADLRFECLRTLAGEKNPPDWLWRKFRSIVAANTADTARSEELVRILPVGLLVSLDMRVLGEEAQLHLIERFVSYASQDESWFVDWEARRLVRSISEFLIAASALPDLSDAVVNALDALSTAEWLEEGDRIAGALAGRRATMSNSVDDLRLQARSATGTKVNDLIELALADRTSGSETLIQGLLENPAAWSHAQFSGLVSHVPPAFLVKAVQATRSHDLMARLWAIDPRVIPEACWEHVDEQQKLVERLVVATLAKDEENIYRIQDHLALLLTKGVSDAAVGRLPLRVISEYYGYRRYHSSVLQAAAPQVVRLQMEALGENPGYWENFNNLADGWSGSLADLLEAARNL
jgi:hypothetical protein